MAETEREKPYFKIDPQGRTKSIVLGAAKALRKAQLDTMVVSGFLMETVRNGSDREHALKTVREYTTQTKPK